MATTLTALEPDELREAAELLSASCRHDRASSVAAEKLFGACPRSTPTSFAAHLDGSLVGVAAACCDRVRVVAVHPHARRRGVGTALLDACETSIAATGALRIRTLDEPGNYLAPGVDVRNLESIEWLERRGYVRGDERTNLLVAVQGNPRVTVARARELVARAATQGYAIRRASPVDAAWIAAAVALEFGGAWPFEIARALRTDPASVHMALHGESLAAFAAHDGNNQRLGWFGPAGTWPAHRGRGLGEALLVACLVDISAAHATAEIAWIGPREFYERTVGVVDTRRFVAMSKDATRVCP